VGELLCWVRSRWLVSFGAAGGFRRPGWGRVFSEGAAAEGSWGGTASAAWGAGGSCGAGSWGNADCTCTGSGPMSKTPAQAAAMYTLTPTEAHNVSQTIHAATRAWVAAAGVPSSGRVPRSSAEASLAIMAGATRRFPKASRVSWESLEVF
jgi:hypothetical protein